MKHFIGNIEEQTQQNNDYRRVIYTSHYTQLVLMSLKPGVEIGNEIHGLDQFIRVESGKAKVILNNGESEHEMTDDWAVIIPAGTFHNIINTGDTELKLYTLYSPPEHLKDTVQPTKADEVEDHFDGKTTE
ncbi:MAG TPA: cupin domain-containing protein [Candidatus Saccharimonadales bacterium]|jgi:mannose-6-phosphate isomerase-like protein (cupin superfamily)|nr:cupin domain-containing protein [Candidatus Saccharimonadales bacterium]